jgi:hypothetical protein
MQSKKEPQEATGTTDTDQKFNPTDFTPTALSPSQTAAMTLKILMILGCCGGLLWWLNQS